MVKLYELVNQHNGVSFSPFVIATKLFLKHKNIQFDTTPLTFTEVGPTIKKVTNDQWARVPTVEFDNGDTVFDSPKIAEYLDQQFPEPKLIRDNSEVNDMVQKFREAAGGHMFKLIVMDIYASADDENKAYLRESREKMFGMTLEEFSKDPEANILAYYEHSKQITSYLESHKFFDGDAPAFNDYVMMASVQLMRTISPKMYIKLVEQHPNPAFLQWVHRMDELFNGYLKNYKTL